MTIRTYEREAAWDFAGIRDESGRLGRPIATDLLYVPAAVELRRGRLVWEHWAGTNTMDPPDYSHPPTAILPGPTLLEEFVRLVDGPDEAIANYARKWGMLGICKHDLPRTHSRRLMNLGSSFDTYCDLLLNKTGDNRWPNTGWEPLKPWRRFARKARSILDVAACLHEGNFVKDNKVAAGFETPIRSEKTWSSERHRRAQIFNLSAEVNRWLVIGSVRPLFSWSEVEEPSVSLGTTDLCWPASMRRAVLSEMIYSQGTSLFGALGVQLLLAVARERGFAVCSECGMQYSPERTPNPKRHRYCQKCGLKAARRAASRRYRARIRPHDNN